MSTLATEPKAHLNIPDVATSVHQLVRQVTGPLTRSQSTTEVEAAANEDQADAAHQSRLTELEQSLVGVSPSMAAIRQLILEVAPTRASVMIYGESGTGKELVAQAIHRYSKQSNGPFVPVNMAAIPNGLAESLLFGHEKGAFTSAVHNQKGWCEAADGGTLFLDEVGDMELQVQPKLLRFLQEGTMQRVGSQVSQRIAGARDHGHQPRSRRRRDRWPHAGRPVLPAACGAGLRASACATGRKIFQRWQTSFCNSQPSVTTEWSIVFPTTRCACCSSTIGREMFDSLKIRSSGW